MRVYNLNPPEISGLLDWLRQTHIETNRPKILYGEMSCQPATYQDRLFRLMGSLEI